MALFKEQAKTAKKQALSNTNEQTISNFIIRWLDKLSVVGSADSKNKIEYIWSGTQAEYDALESVDDNTLYFIE